MSLEKKVPYEEPSEDEWKEIETLVFDELAAEPSPAREARRPVWAWAAGAVAAMVAVMVGLALFLRPAPPPAPVTQATRLASTDAPSRASLGEVRVELAEDSSGVAVGNDAQGWVVTLEHGSAVFSVPPRRDRPPFVVHAGDVRVEVVGTRFRVARELSRVEVEVHRGVVRVTSGDRLFELRGGDVWPNPPEDSSEPAEDPALLQGAPEAAVVEPEANEERAGVDDAALFQRASALEASEPRRAARIYAAISHRAGRWSGAALFARARLELDQGHPAAAEPLLRRYLRRHPDGLNARDARGMLDRLDRTD